VESGGEKAGKIKVRRVIDSYGRVGEHIDCFSSEREVLNGEVEGDDFVEGY
jgi:hypothetical protein